MPLTEPSPRPAYPSGDWKLTPPSALQFEHTWLQILEQKNVAALDRMLAPEFKDTARKGALRPKAQILRELPLQKERDNFRQRNDRFGDTAVVHGST